MECICFFCIYAADMLESRGTVTSMILPILSSLSHSIRSGLFFSTLLTILISSLSHTVLVCLLLLPLVVYILLWAFVITLDTIYLQPDCISSKGTSTKLVLGMS